MGLYLVVNASCKEEDIAHLERRLDAGVQFVGALRARARRAAGAEGGGGARAPRAGMREARVHDRGHLHHRRLQTCWSRAVAIRDEDGFEISVPEDAAAALWRSLVAEPEVEPVGLGARDSLRLEAGLCLYGHDIDETTSPVEAGLTWSVGKRRRREGGFPGAARIQQELAEGPQRRRVGILPDGKAPAREGTTVLDADGAEIGTITSGGFGPTIGRPVAMGYVAAEAAETGRPVSLLVREKPRPATIVKLPFVPHTYHRP